MRINLATKVSGGQHAFVCNTSGGADELLRTTQLLPVADCQEWAQARARQLVDCARRQGVLDLPLLLLAPARRQVLECEARSSATFQPHRVAA